MMRSQFATALADDAPATTREWVCEPEAIYGPPRKPRLLDQVREAIRTRHYSYRTEEAYVGWIRRFILFHRKRHPEEMGAVEITQFLTALAVERRVSASTQNQALGHCSFSTNRCWDATRDGSIGLSAPSGPNVCQWC